jgi:hypothetical protein
MSPDLTTAGRPNLEQRGALGLWCTAGAGALALHSDLPLELTEDRRAARCVAREGAGQRSYLALTYSEDLQ